MIKSEIKNQLPIMCPARDMRPGDVGLVADTEYEGLIIVRRRHENWVVIGQTRHLGSHLSNRLGYVGDRFTGVPPFDVYIQPEGTQIVTTV